MKESYGETTGSIVHFVAYVIIPIAGETVLILTNVSLHSLTLGLQAWMSLG